MAGATLVIRILADAKQAQDTMKKASGKGGAFAGMLGKAALPAAAVGAGLAVMGKNAAVDARAQTILANTLKKTTGATDKQIAASEAWISKTSLATGVADDELRPALGALSRATGDVGLSQDAMNVALDVAAATGKDFGTVALAMAKGYNGNTGALARLVPGIDKAALKSKNMSAVMGDLAKKTGGSAAKAADTAAGKMDRAALAMDELQETIGGALLPVLGILGGLLQKAAAFGQEHEGVTKVLVIGVGALAAGILILNAALKAYEIVANAVKLVTKLWKSEQLQLNLAFLTNPIFLVIAIIVALVVAVVIAYKKSETFRKIVQGAWKGIKTAIFAVWNFIKTYVFAPLLAYYTLLWKGAQIAVRLIVEYFKKLWEALKKIWGFIKRYVIDPIVTAFQAVADGISGAFKIAIDWIKKVIDWIKKIKIPKPVQWLIDKGKAVFSSSPAPATTPPAPVVAGRGGRAAPPAAATTTGSGALAALSPDAQVIVQLSDRKLVDLIDVRIRASATAAARTLTRRSVVTV